MSTTPLKHALVDHDEPAWRVALKTDNISEVRLSKLASGRAVPRDEEKDALSDVLGKPVQELFPEPHTHLTT